MRRRPKTPRLRTGSSSRRAEALCPECFENHYAPQLESIPDVGEWRTVGDLSSSELLERAADVAAAAERLREWAAWYEERAGLASLADREREFRHDETIAQLANELAEFDDEEVGES